MRKILIFFTCSFVFIFFCKNTIGKGIDSTTAKKASIKFYYKEINKLKPVNLKDIIISKSYTIKSHDIPVLYVFNIQKGGFVIMACDDNVYPIIGFSFEGNYQEENQPPAYVEWIDNIGKQIKYSLISNFEKNTKIEEIWNYLLSDNYPEHKESEINKNVNPLLTTIWDQGVYYNDSCPVYPNGPGGHAVTGCIATAMAQIMNYYKYPEHGQGSLTIDDPRFVPTLSADFAKTTYNWSNLPNHLTSSNPDVARLMYHCGISVNMYYGIESSSFSSWVPNALVKYFNYHPMARYISRDDFSIKQWDSLLIDNLDAGKPILYSGNNQYGNGGHAWVCDGYLNSRYFHFNWGWSGSNNGYFYVDTIHVIHAGGYDFSYQHSAVINIAPYFYPYCSEHKVYTDSTGSFGDGSQLNAYWNNTNCSWLISLTDTTYKIAIQFNSFSTEADKDILTIYDGDNNLSPLLASLSGHNIPPSIVSPGHKMFLQFNTDSVNQDVGWNLSYYSTLTGINTPGILNNICVFPNPAKDYFNVLIENMSQKKISMTLNSIIGIKLFSEKFTGNKNRWEKKINLTGLPKGIYILSIIIDKEIIYRKIIIN
jgi:hypothetical protein